MPQMLSCTGLQELALEAQDILAALKVGELTELDLPADFKPAVGLVRFAVSLRQTAQELGKPITITTQDPALLETATACGLDELFMFYDVEDLIPNAPSAPEIPATQAPPEPEASSRSRPPSPPAQAETSIRVGTSKLDSLVDQVGELVIFDARLSELARQPKDPNLVALAEQITRLSLGLRDTAMSIRMVPFGTLASRFERLVADLSMNLGKDVDMIVSGCDTELDKTMIEKLADPLVHIVRNSMDHGIEKAEDRAAAGKPASGSIEIKAEHIGSEVIVTVKDDGKGLDADRIHAKAVEKGILAADEQVSQNRLFSLIFEPAFSTQTQVSALSGRGVGMDVVKKTIDSLRGRVEVAGEKYTIPVSVVNEIVDLPPANYVGNTASDFLNVLVPEIEQTSILVSQISVSMRELAMGTDQITTAVRQLDQVTQENTAASEELSSSAVELSSQAENLKDAISFFELPRARGILRRTKAARKKSRTSQSGYAYNLGHSSPKKPAKKPERQPKSFDFDLDSDVTDEDDAQFERYAAE